MQYCACSGTYLVDCKTPENCTNFHKLLFTNQYPPTVMSFLHKISCFKSNKSFTGVIYLIFLCMASLTFSCISNTGSDKFEDQDNIIQIDIETAYNEPSPVLLSRLVDEIEYIPLEFTPECVIDRLSGIKITLDYIFAYDYNAVFQFSRSGKYIRQVGSNGRAAGE